MSQGHPAHRPHLRWTLRTLLPRLVLTRTECLTRGTEGMQNPLCPSPPPPPFPRRRGVAREDLMITRRQKFSRGRPSFPSPKRVGDHRFLHLASPQCWRYPKWQRHEAISSSRKMARVLGRLFPMASAPRGLTGRRVRSVAAGRMDEGLRFQAGLDVMGFSVCGWRWTFSS